jgi:hypothetical protein
VLHATVAALPWRDPEHMGRRTRDVVFQALTSHGHAHETFDSILAVAAQETGPDALWLHGLLVNRSVRQRDEFLAGYLHDRVGVSSAVERLLGAPFEVEVTKIPEPVLLRWAVLLLWFCVAPDRRVRDRATKGLVAITAPRPAIWASLIRRFSRVNDDYVVERCLCAAYGALLRTRDADAEREVAATAYEVVFTDPLRFQNALTRDHARCIVELANHDGVLPEGASLEAARPTYQSEWPLTIPSEADVEPYQENYRDFPKLHLSCLTDDFFTYVLSRLEPYEHAVSRKDMGRWVLGHVVNGLGYGGEVLASYDGYMVYTHGSGRGRPGWAERVGKKYQWIALARLAARLGDNVKPRRRSWDPKPRGTPLVYDAGRDIDPSLLTPGRLSDRHGEAWWLPVGYDFASVSALQDADWAARHADVPDSEALLRPLARADGGNWQLLEGYPEWSARPDEDDDEFTPHRRIWMHVRGYLVKAKSAEAAFDWLGRQNLMGRWMTEGAEFHEGFMGEYPWAIPFTLFPDRWHSKGGKNDCPERFMPVCNSVTSTFGEDAYQQGSVTAHVPIRAFFADAALRWDGLSGYRTPDGRLRFLDPSLAEPGKSALLVDRDYLLDFLKRKKLALIWAVLGEKIVLGHGSEAPRLEFRRTHMLGHDGQLRSTALQWSGEGDEEANVPA